MSEELQPEKSGVIDIDHPYKGHIGNDEIRKKYKGVNIGLNGDYKLMPDIRKAVEIAGQEFLRYAEEHGIDLKKFGFDINGDGHVGVQKAGSGCLALALSHGKQDWRGKKDQVISTFDTGEFEVSGILEGEDWLAAEQVLGDNWPQQVKQPTHTATADKAFIGRYGTGSDKKKILDVNA